MSGRIVRAICWLAVLQPCAWGQAQESAVIVSSQPSAVSLTIYRDFVALVTETREVDLPPGAVRLVLQGVVETLIPQSAVLRGVEARLAESNHRFDALTPDNLLRRSVGEHVVLTRTNPGTGEVVRTAATILSANAGLILRTGDGDEILRCAGLPERLEFERVPDGLAAKPELAVFLNEGQGGRQTVTLSYLAFGFSWESNYVARLDESGSAMELTGWATLRNYTARDFRNASVQLVAGRLHLLAAEQGGSRAPSEAEEDDDDSLEPSARDAAREQFIGEVSAGVRDDDAGPTHALTQCLPVTALPTERQALQGFAAPASARGRGGDEMEEVIVTAAMKMEIERLADYHLYRIPWATDLGARSTKQAVFLQKPAVPVNRYYEFRLADLDDDPGDEDEPQVPTLKVRFENTQRATLGEPLPRGVVRLFVPDHGWDLFVGEAAIADKAAGLPVELALGGAMDLSLTASLTEDHHSGWRQTPSRFEHAILLSNAKSLPVTFELRQDYDGPAWRNVTIRNSSVRPTFRDGHYVWRITAPPNSMTEIRYVVVARGGD